MQVRPAILLIAFSIAAGVLRDPEPALAQTESDQSHRQRRAFFEAKIRPVLIERCLECHSTETEANGGLLLDSKAGWIAGGESGPVIKAGDPDESRLWKAMSYDDPGLQMPPDGKLPQPQLEAFRKWISDGAIDPREDALPKPTRQTGLPVERAADHWAYRALTKPTIPKCGEMDSSTPVDLVINRKLEESGLTATPSADPNVLLRRLYFDLTGLPPSSEEASKFSAMAKCDDEAYERLVDRLLESPHYGERFARNWMDVARYAESITLRGFILPEAWRYRDYLVQSFAEDRPFDQMIREQIAGDLLHSDDLRERQMQLTATTFLALGNTNLETQDKSQLEMDYVDEQLDVIGGAFLGQTIGCARCHDHKFDPIPTRDYYAMAGIFRSAAALKHANLSQWIEQPLPLPQEEESFYQELESQLATINQQITTIEKATSKKLANDIRLIPIRELAGVVVDNRDAKLVGQWTESTSVGRYVGDGYIHDGNVEKGKKTATFEPAQLPPGPYQVRLAYSASANRASNVIVRVFSADGEATIVVNQQQQPPEEAVWTSLGKYRFEKDGQAFVLVTNDKTDGHVILDAVQFLPIVKETSPAIASGSPESTSKAELPENTEAEKQLLKELASLKNQRKTLEQRVNRRPRYMTIVEKQPPADIPIHIRGDVHHLGEIVPRGFLTALGTEGSERIGEGSSGRLELADWICSSRNPLTARVYANRVWSWVTGQGIVLSVNNFGTTGVAPTHPELLDWLAGELIRSGWSTKHLVRIIVLSSAYRRRVADPDELQMKVDPANRLYWRGNSRRLTAESLRDSMLQISGELDRSMGGSLITAGTNADYNFHHTTTRRSLFHPVFRNSLPELFEAFDFADASVSIGQRPRSTVATQALVLLNHPWVVARAKATAQRLRDENGEDDAVVLVRRLFQDCFCRQPTDDELSLCITFLQNDDSVPDVDRLQALIHSLFASLDFRYLD